MAFKKVIIINIKIHFYIKNLINYNCLIIYFKLTTMKNLLRVICFAVLAFLSFNVNAAHQVGGDVEYECIGPRTWKIRLTLYRNCNGISLCQNMSCTAPMTAKPNTTLNPAGCSATPNNVALTLSLVKVEDVGKENVALCGNAAKNGCTNLGQVGAGPHSPSMEKYVFEGTLNLSMASLNNSNCAYWDVFYEVCCRDAGIWNLVGSSGQSFRIGATINIFNRSQNPCKNNSPILKNESVVRLHSGIEYILNSGAVDPDGDSLSYELSHALEAGGGPVNYQAPGSANKPFPLDSSKSPHINSPQPNGPYVIIDSVNGDISFTPLNNTAGLIYGNMNVRIKQWTYNANGSPLLVGITHRDMQLFVLNSTGNNPPRFITTPSLPNNQPKYNHNITAGQQLCFTITAKDTDVYPLIPRYDTTFISWNEGIVRPGKLTFLPNYTVTPNQPRPREDTWQFCWQTDSTDIRSIPYYFTVTAKDNFCPNIGHITKAFSIKVTNGNNPPTPIPNHTSIKAFYICGNVRYSILKRIPFVTLDSASLRIANMPNDKNFLLGFRNINPININPQGSLQDSTPRLMFTDSLRYTQPGKYYVSFTYKAIQGAVTQVLDSFEISIDSIALANIFTQFNTNFCNGDSSLIMSSYTNPKYKYQWQKNGVNIVGSITEGIYAKQSGSYRLLVTDTVLNCNNYSNAISFTANPRVMIKPSLIQNTYCAFNLNGINYYDSSTISSGTFTRLWHFGDGTTSSTLLGTKLYNSAGSYLVKLLVTSNMGCKDSIVTNVTIANPTNLNITSNSNTSFCNGKSVMLSSSSNFNGNYFWYKNNVLLNNVNSSTLTVGEAGNYKLIVDLGNNCKDTSNVIATELYPSPKVGFTINNPTQCVNANLFSLIDTTSIFSGTYNRVWTWDNNSSGQANLDLSFNTVGTKSIKLKATSNNGCSDSLVKTITILAKLNIGTLAGPTSNLSTQQSYDYNLNQQLNHSYNWTVTNGNIVNGQGTNAVKVQWLTPGTGKLNAVISNNVGCSDSSSLNVSIIGSGQTAPTITSFTPQTGTNGTLITINGTNLNNASSVTFGGVNAKSYTVVSPLIITAIVDSGATGNVSVVTPNGTALLNGFTYTTNTGIAKFASQSFSIFPNPVSAEIVIESNKSLNESRFELMDVNGKVLINTTCNTPTNRLIMDVKSLSPAMYFLRITSQGQSNTVKIIKQ